MKHKKMLWLAAVILWMGLIFWFSAQSGMKSSGMSDGIAARIVRLLIPDYLERSAAWQEEALHTASFLIRKAAHFAEYAVLGILLSGLLGRKRAAAWGIGTVYAVTDEWHQSFSAGRSPQITDVCIDSAGVLAGLFLFWLFGRVIASLRRKKNDFRENETAAKQ